MIEFEVSGQTYRAEKLDARSQFHVARRIAPLLSAVLTPDTERRAPEPVTLDEEGVPIEAPSDERVSKVLGAVAAAIGKMSDADADYVLDRCLSVVKRKQGAVWAAVLAPGGGLMFSDIDMPAMIGIAWQVMGAANLPGFFPMPQPSSVATPQA